MKLCKRSIITSSLLAILAISSAYGATPVQPTESTDSAVIEMDYSNLPELKKSIESATPAMVQSTLMLLRENLPTVSLSIQQSLCLVTVLYP